jgi:hypothetical protein
VPPTQRFSTLSSLLEQTQLLMKTYFQRDMSTAKGDPSKLQDSTEAIAYMDAQLNLLAALLPVIVDELMPSLPPQHPKAEAARGALEQVRNGLTGTVQGAITTINARRAPLGDRRQLSETLRYHSDSFGRRLHPAQVVQIDRWLEEASKQETDATLVSNLQGARKGFNAPLRLLPGALR